MAGKGFAAYNQAMENCPYAQGCASISHCQNAGAQGGLFGGGTAVYVDIVLTGHLHTYRNRGHIIQGRHDPKGPLYILCGLAGNVRYDRLWTDHALDEVVAPQPETDNYMTMDVEGNVITIRCFLPDGTKIDETKVQK